MRRWMSGLLAAVLVLAMLPTAVCAEPETAGKSALLMEKTTGQILYERNAHEPLAPASVTKVMTMLLIMEAVDSGRISMEDTVTASEAAAAKGGSQVYLKVGETMTVRDMLKSIAVSSANDCACAMAEFICGSEASFVDAMNQRAGELGMNDTHFVNCTGLDDGENASRHRTSAHDIALMSRELIGKHPAIRAFTTIWMDTIRNGAFGLSNTNKLIRFYPGATGLKTGYTSGAGYCLSATAERDGMELIAVSMGCETSKIRAAACKSMLDYGFANYALVTAELPESSCVAVKLGAQSLVKAVPEGSGTLLVEKAMKNTVTTRVELTEEVEAPVAAGEKLGTVQILSGDRELKTLNLVAAESVEKITYLQMVKKTLLAFCGISA